MVPSKAMILLQTFNCNSLVAVAKKNLPFLQSIDFPKVAHSKKVIDCKKSSEKLFPSICVDSLNGIFMVASTMSGLAAPIHVVNHKSNQKQLCSKQTCSDIMNNAQNPALECIHLRSCVYGRIPKPVTLDKNVLLQLLKQHLINTKTMERCISFAESAENDLVPLAMHVDFSEFGFKERTMYFSVYTEKSDYFCKFKRVRVTFDSEAGTWSCKCPLSSERKHCIHEYICKWYLYQVRPAKLEKFSR